jgi:SAM-dependent methyltransferase
MGRTLRPHVGDRVLEIGAGIGTLTNQFIPRELYVASDINPNYLSYLRSYSYGKPYLRVKKIDAEDPADFKGLEGCFDTAIMVNVLEHVSKPDVALRNLYEALEPGGRVVILVPQHPGLFGTLDEVLEHHLRYKVEDLRAQIEAAGFAIESVTDFNRTSVPGWWFNGRVLRRNSFSRLQLKAIDVLMPVIKRFDRMWPWGGLSLIATAKRPS